MVPLRVSEKRSRGSRIGTVGFAGLAAPTAGDPESRLRLSGALLSFSCRRLVFTLTTRMPSSRLPGVARGAQLPGARARLRVAAPTPRAFRPPAPAQCSRARSRSGRPGTRARAQRPVRPEGGGGRGGVTGEREGGGGGGRVASVGARARPRARPPPCPNPARVKRFLPACSGRRDLTPRWRTARMSTRPKRAACPFSIQR